jgi:putative DNA primase/helicase
MFAGTLPTARPCSPHDLAWVSELVAVIPAASLPHVTLEEFLLTLQKVKQTKDGYQAQCPAHEDSTPSLSVKIGNKGGVLAKCRAGCSFTEVVRAVGFEPSQLCAPKVTPKPFPTIVQTYDYRDAAGVLKYQVARFEPKDFRQRQPKAGGQWSWNMNGVTRLPYRLNELAGHTSVFIAEGEKDVDALWSLGCPATTNVGGAGKWHDGETQALKNLGVLRVIVLPDNDGPGRKHADDIARQMKANGIACTILELPGLRAHGDVSDWFSQGHQRAELDELAAAKPYVVQTAPAPVPSVTADIDAELKDHQSRTSVGQAERFAELYGKDFRYNHFRQTWLHYESPCWRIDADKAVYRAATEFARIQQREALTITNHSEKREALAFAVKAESPAALKNMIDCATWNLTFSDRGDNWDTDPWALAVENGVLDLKTGVLRAGNPADRITLKCSVPYNAKAECPRWWQFLGEIFGGDEELIEFIWRLSGYFLTGQTTERVVPMFYGRGANGKSVFLNVLASILGDYAFALPFSSLQFQKQEGIPNDLAALVGRRFVTMIEANDGLRLNEAKLKTLSGNDRISARFLHGEFFTFQPVAKFVLAMNHKPVAKDDSPGFWDRIRLVPFLHTFPLGSRDETLQARLIQTEGAGILAWMVEGCLRWQSGGLTRPASVVAATAEYQADSDQLAEFLAACCDTSDSEAFSAAAEVQKAYNAWADGRGLNKIERLSATTLGRQLGERFSSKHTMKGRVYNGLQVYSSQLW